MANIYIHNVVKTFKLCLCDIISEHQARQWDVASVIYIYIYSIVVYLRVGFTTLYVKCCVHGD